MKTRTILFWIIFLIIVDQTIKIIIQTYFGNCQFGIIPSLFEFKPIYNTKHSWINVLLNNNFGFNIGLFPHIILFFLIGFLSLAYYLYYRNCILKNVKLLDTSFIFLYAGLICALIGNLIWEKGTLDYIYLKPLFVFDLKDLYLDIFIVTFIIYFIKNKSQLRPIKSRNVFSYVKSILKTDKIIK